MKRTIIQALLIGLVALSSVNINAGLDTKSCMAFVLENPYTRNILLAASLLTLYSLPKVKGASEDKKNKNGGLNQLLALPKELLKALGIIAAAGAITLIANPQLLRSTQPLIKN